MPAIPVVAGPATTTGGSLAGQGAANAIAFGTLAAGSGLGLAALPADTVAIANIGLSLAPQSEIYVGDRIVFTAQIDVSFGCIDDDGKGGTIKVELIENGTVLAIEERAATSPKETFSFRYKNVTVNHGKNLYRIKVTATGEEDLSYWPSGDSTVTRVRESDTVPLEIKKPIEVTIDLLASSVVHGQAARAIMKISNRSESDGYVAALIDSSLSTLSGRMLRGRETDVRIIDHIEAHGGNDHAGEVSWYFEPVELYYHAHYIIVGNNTVKYDQIAPDKTTLFNPLSITCKGNLDRRVGYIPGGWDDHIPDGWDGWREKTGEYGYACMTIDEKAEPFSCSAVFADNFGNIIAAVRNNNELQFQGVLTGTAGIITFTPDNPAYAPYSFNVLLDEDHVKGLPKVFQFFPPSIPALKGLVFIKTERLPVKNCRVELAGMDGKIISQTITDNKGRFSIQSNPGNINDTGHLMLTVKLPWDITYGWTEPILSKKVTRKEILDQTLFVFDAEVLSQETLVKISGKVVSRDRINKKNIPVKDVEVTVSDELGEMQVKLITDPSGQYSVSVKPGKYFIAISNSAELGYDPHPSKLFTARTSKDDVDICLTLPRPKIHYSSTGVIEIKPASKLNDRLVVLSKGKIIKEYKLSKPSFYISRKDLNDLSAPKAAYMHGEIIGPTVTLDFESQL
jgi:hypothetical protein